MGGQLESNPILPILIGSNFSPFVRRVRIYCEHHSIAYQWHPITNMLEKNLPEVNDNNPAKQIPVLITKQHGAIWDSRVIMQYFAELLSLPKLTWQEEMQLAAVNNLNDTCVSLFLAERSQLNPMTSEALIFKRMRDRVKSLLKHFNAQFKQNPSLYQNWNTLSIALYTTWDWMLFRKLIAENDAKELIELNRFLFDRADAPGVKATDPRQFPQ
jgi:glutathione S-transferase